MRRQRTDMGRAQKIATSPGIQDLICGFLKANAIAPVRHAGESTLPLAATLRAMSSLRFIRFPGEARPSGMVSVP